jgi:glycosyltransferase involved in cell wall biosynthesis
MKVAFISGCLEYSVCLANALSKKCQIEYFYNGAAVRQRDDSVLSLLEEKIVLNEMNSYRVRDPRNYTSYRRIAKMLSKFDVVHIQGSDIWLSLNRHCFGKVPIVCTIHDPLQHVGLPWLNRSFQTVAQNIAIAQSAEFIVHGDKLKSILAASNGIPAHKINVIPHGEFSFYRSMKNGAGDDRKERGKVKRILFFGEIRKNKGLEYLIRAEPLISARCDDYKICLAGRFKHEKGNSLQYYRSLMQNPDRFEIHDRFIGNHEVADFFDTSDIVVLPYIGASQSGILAIAFGFGIPVVATDTGSMGEVVTDGLTGLLVPPTDAKALAEALTHLLNDDDLRRKFGALAGAEAGQKLNWDTIADQTLAVYRRSLS